MTQDLRAELHFYGKKLDRLAIIYVKTSNIPVRYPDILFLTLFVLKLFASRKLNTSVVGSIQKKLSYGESLQKVFSCEEDRPFEKSMFLCEYYMLTKSVIRSQILFYKDNRFSFVLGTSGFGIFSNRRHFEHCAEGSILGLIEKFSFMFHDDPASHTALFSAISLLSKVEFHKQGGHNLSDLATKIYSEATGDEYVYNKRNIGSKLL